ncbi:FAD-dependent oxidoreductase [Labilibacter marinus]|uniref:FAD-dependent oxidoreductase n=1 Tax=Labilibacter marinus TaxID=1477105 RepID=UPI00082FFD4F|nr:FAD-dependent oxidoreductase [Labilibacter marinus]
MGKKIIVIGGLSAGPSAAAKARRQNEDAEIVLFEKTKNISYATCGIPYALSGVINDRDNLMVVEANLLRERFNIDVHLQEEVLDIDPDKHIVKTNIAEYNYDKLVYTAGASTFIPPVKNIEQAKNWSACRTLEDFDRIMQKDVIEDAKHITVMGAGLIGVEVAENLREAGKEVTLIEGGDGILPMWEGKFRQFAKTTMEKHGIKVVTNTFVKEFDVNEGQITGVQLSETETQATDFVIMSVGIKPNSHLLTSKGAEYIGNGAVKVNEKMETTLPDIYAAGDCASIKNTQTGEYDYLPLGTHSNKGGRTAGVNAAGGQEEFKGGYKTAIVKVFENTMGRTGMGPAFMTQNNIDFAVNLIVAGSTPGYYPDQKDMIVETYYNPKDGTILGCEAFGEKGVDKRIDIMSTAIYAKLKMSDLPNLDLAYAPPYSPAKDPVIVSGYVTSNVLNGQYTEVDAVTLKDLIENTPEGEYNLIDVRNPNELQANGKIANAINIPLEQLRDSRLEGMDASKPTYIYCAKGLRGYLGYLILADKGFKNIKNLSGGFLIWSKLN